MAEVRNFRKCKVAEFRVNAELLAAQQVVKVKLHKTRVNILQNLSKLSKLARNRTTFLI